MAGIGFIIFGIFVTLFGYVLITCAVSGRRHISNRTTAEITGIRRLSDLDSLADFFEVTVQYIIDAKPIISTFNIHTLGTYQTGKRIEILFNPDKPSQILSATEKVKVSPLFIIITAFGVLSLLLGTIFTILD